MTGLGNRTFALSLIRSSLISALLKRAIERFLTHLLFKKERMSENERSLIIYMNKCWAIGHRSFLKERLCDSSLNRSFKKSERAKMSDRSFSK